MQTDPFDHSSYDLLTGPVPGLSPEALTKARLKWFNVPKGFGFVVLDGEDVDAFLHITTLQRASLPVPGEGTEILCVVDRGPRGAHVVHIERVLFITESTPSDAPLPSPPPPEGGIAVQGSVKWYKPDKGFGFVVPDDGMKDVFVHKSCLDRHGLEMLEAGQRIHMLVRLVPKGREAISIELRDDGAAHA